MRPVQKISSHVIWKTETMIEEDIKYKKHYIQDNDASVPFKVGTLGPHILLPITISCPSYFPESHERSEISSPSKVILVLGKARSRRLPNLGCRGDESPTHLMFCEKLHEMGCMSEYIIVRKLPILGFWIIQIVPAEECSSLTQNLMPICCFACSVILNVMATQYTCFLKGIYCPKWGIWWSCRHSHMLVYIGVTQIILILLTLAGIFPDIPCVLISSKINDYYYSFY